MRREPHFPSSARVWTLAETGHIEGLMAAHSFTTLFYLYRRQGDPGQAYSAIRRLLRVFAVAGVDQGVLEAACDLAWRDFEDAVQAMAAIGAGCNYLITRNPRDYDLRPLTVLEPAAFLAVWAAEQDRKGNIVT